MSIVSTFGNWVGKAVRRGLATIGVSGEKAVAERVTMQADKSLIKSLQPGVLRMADGQVMINVASPGPHNAIWLVPAEMKDGVWHAIPQKPRPAVARPRPAAPVSVAPPPLPLPVVDAAMAHSLGLNGAREFNALTRSEMVAHIAANKPVILDVGGQRFLGHIQAVPGSATQYRVYVPTDDVKRVIYQGRELIVDGGASTIQSVKSFELRHISRQPIHIGTP